MFLNLSLRSILLSQDRHPPTTIIYLKQHFQILCTQIIPSLISLIHTLNQLPSILCTSFHYPPKYIQNVLPDQTPEIEPIELEPSHMALTPITSGLIQQEMQDIMDDFILDISDLNQVVDLSQEKRRRSKKAEFKKNFGLQMFRLDCDLQKIIQHEDQDSFTSQMNSSFNDYSEDIVYENNDQCCNSNTFYTNWNMKVKSKDNIEKDIQQERQSTIDISNVDYSETLDLFRKNPRVEIIKKLQQIENLTHETDEDQKKILIKKFLEKYLLEYEVHCFQQSWRQLNSSLKHTVSLITRGIEQTFEKTISSLSFENRRVKLVKYLEKKKRRIWRKKVSYDCRKKVADGRLRIKGKFVTREQACEQLGLDNLDHFSAEQIKEMLESKYDEYMSIQATEKAL